MSNRDFLWLASTDENNAVELQKLDANLFSFYSELNRRQKYNTMINGAEDDGPTDEITNAFVNWFEQEKFKNLLEIGCGTGRIRKRLVLDEGVKYTGTEISEDLIEKNKALWPGSEWYAKSIYHLGFSDRSFDLVYSFYVLEHLVFPKKALEEMYRITKPGGSIVVIFPNFVEYDIFPSQFMGLSFLRSAKEKIKKGKIIDAVVSLYDSKIRMKNAMRILAKKPGSFTINTNPICLYLSEQNEVWPDFDAVYIAGRAEVESWAVSKNMQVSYPSGKEGLFRGHVFMVMKK